MSALQKEIPSPEVKTNVVKMSASTKGALKHAGFLVRAGAMIIDGLIVLFASFPLQIIALLIFKKVFGIHSPQQIYLHRTAMSMMNLSVTTLVIYLYFGYFYSTRGATPGKTLLGLKVLKNRGGKYLSYNEAFLREFLGKSIIETCTLGIGYLLVAFRKDGLSLHDLIFNTRVVEQNDR